MSSAPRSLPVVANHDRICVSCREKTCCDYYSVTVTARDVLRIARALQLGPAEFLSAAVASEPEPGAFLLHPDGPHYLLLLTRRESGPGHATCVFSVRTNDGHRQCGLGELRPAQCGTFPAYRVGELVGVVADPPGCVRSWSYADVDLEEARRRITRAEDEQAEYHALVEEWNRRVVEAGREHGFDEFCAFVLNRVLEEDGEQGVPGPCASCRKRCCSEYTVSITGYDAWFLAKELHLPLESFLVHFPVGEGHARGFVLEPGGPSFEIALDKQGEYRKGNPCVFWLELPNGGGRCGVYAQRPRVCQTYPTYQLQDTVVLRDDVLCPSGAWNLTGMALPVFRRRLSHFRMERDIYAYFVDRWNRHVERGGRARGLGEYFVALLNVYDELARSAAESASDLGAEMVRRWAELPASAPNPLVADVVGDDPRWRSFVNKIRDSLQRATAWGVEAERPAAE